MKNNISAFDNLEVHQYARNLETRLTASLEPFVYEAMTDATLKNIQNVIYEILQREKDNDRISDFFSYVYPYYGDYSVILRIKIKPTHYDDWVNFTITIGGTDPKLMIKRKIKKIPEEFVNLVVRLADYAAIATKRDCDKVNDAIADIGEYLKNNGDYLIGKYLRVVGGKFYEDNNIEPSA